MSYVKMVWAQARESAIGRAGSMPWHLPEDLAHFKRETLGAPVIMGRRTWESLPESFRPLPGRLNIVVTRDPEYVAAGAEVQPSLSSALQLADDGSADLVCVIGGGELYRAAMPLADELVVTRIEIDVADADTFAPEIDDQWKLAESSEQLRAANGTSYRFERYLRARAA